MKHEILYTMSPPSSNSLKGGDARSTYLLRKGENVFETTDTRALLLNSHPSIDALFKPLPRSDYQTIR